MCRFPAPVDVGTSVISDDQLLVLTAARVFEPAHVAGLPVVFSEETTIRARLRPQRITRGSGSEQTGVGAAVDGNGGAGDEAGGVGAEEGDDRAEVLGAAEYTGGDVLGHFG